MDKWIEVTSEESEESGWFSILLFVEIFIIGVACGYMILEWLVEWI